MIRQFETIIQGYVPFVMDSNSEGGEDPIQGNSKVDEPSSVFSIATNVLFEMNNVDLATATYSRSMQTTLLADLMHEATEAQCAKGTDAEC